MIRSAQSNSMHIGLPQRLALILAVLAMPILCFTTGVRVLALNPGFFEWGQERHMQYREPGPQERAAADLALARYFADGADTLPQQFRAVGLSGDFFGERALIHMKDVHGLISLAGWGQTATGIYLLAVLLLSGLGKGGLELRRAARSLAWGAGLTLAMLIILALGAALDFDALFLQFHLMSFSNDLWQLDPRYENLIRMFPAAFFMEAALAAVGLAAAQATLIGGAALWWLRRR